jgi:hypothetical protein
MKSGAGRTDPIVRALFPVAARTARTVTASAIASGPAGCTLALFCDRSKFWRQRPGFRCRWRSLLA